MSNSSTVRVEQFHSVVGELRKFKSADHLAEYLRGQGVKGECSEPSKCPLARYMQGRLALSETDLDVDAYDIVYRYGDGYDDWVSEDVCESAVHDFVTLFDKKEYPDLIAEPVPA